MKLYNTLSKKVENVEPINAPNLNMFVCGPTVYDFSHLGHAKTYIQMDTLARTLKASGFNLNYILNITDIDDKIIARASENNIDWKDLATKYEKAYLEDMKRLNNNSVTVVARATDHIEDIIRQVNTLLDKKHAYIIEGDGIYFEIATFPSYGKLSGRQEVLENDSESRIDQSENKRGWNDFCLWKFSKPGEPVWEAPFGDGRPGWHIEDTAITEHFFGPQYDIHGGAVDLIFPHHEAEITQMEAASGKIPFVKYWVHSGFLNIDSTKMSKSLGNFHTVRDVLDTGVHPGALRLLMLQSHYRSGIDFSFENLSKAEQRLKSLQAMADIRFQVFDDVENTDQRVDYFDYSKRFLEALQDDINTPKALAIISEVEDLSANGISTKDEKGFLDFLGRVDELFGLDLLLSKDISSQHKQLIQDRSLARNDRKWDESDQLRIELQKEGIGINDTPAGTIWFRL